MLVVSGSRDNWTPVARVKFSNDARGSLMFANRQRRLFPTSRESIRRLAGANASRLDRRQNQVGVPEALQVLNERQEFIQINGLENVAIDLQLFAPQHVFVVF